MNTNKWIEAIPLGVFMAGVPFSLVPFVTLFAMQMLQQLSP